MQRNYVTIRPLNREDSVLYFPPEAFGPFRVLHQIGAGTLGPVFRAHEPSGEHRDRLVAVKVFRLDLTPGQAAALVNELNALVSADLSHPNIAAPIAAGVEHGAVYIAQEYVVGDSLDVALRDRGPMSMAGGVGLVDALSDAIDYAADRGVHHGALHLRDVLLATDGPRITGFGITAALAKIGARRPTRPQYSSPDSPSDVYSLAAMTFEAITGKRVSPENLTEFEREYGGELRSAFSVALAGDPQMRPERAGGFASVLRDAAGLTAEAPPNEDAAADTLAAPAASVEERRDDSDLELQVETQADVQAAPVEESGVQRQPIVHAAWPQSPASPVSLSLPEPERDSRPWPLVAVMAVSAIVVLLSAAFFLRSRNADPGSPAVDTTTVEMPGATTQPAPAESAPKAKPSPAPPPAKPSPSPSTPAPTPSRPASGAVRGADTGNLLIRTTPAEADIAVNGQPRGKTPVVLRDLAFGSYTIRIERSGYEPETRTLELTARRPTYSATIALQTQSAARGAPAAARADSVAADKPVEQEKSAPGGLNVQSRPAGARVYVNDQLAGSTPVAVPDLPAGPARVRIELDGYQPWATIVRISPGEQTRVAASLER